MREEAIFSLIDLALAKGAEAAEVYRLEQASSLVDIKEGKIDSLSQAQQTGVGLRVLEQERMGFAFASDIGVESWEILADKALAAARQSHPDPFLYFPPPPASPYPEVDRYDSQLRAMGLAERVDFAREMEEAARGFDPRVSKVRHCLYQDSNYSVYISNSRGLKAGGQGTYCSCSVEVAADEKGSSETGWDMQSSPFFSDLQGEEVGRRAAEQAVMMLGAKSLPTLRVDVVFSSPTAAEFLEVLSSALMADAVQKQKSLFANQVGTQVASKTLTLVDDGLLPRGSHSFPFDDEGNPAQRTLLIEDGTLKGFLYDSYCAVKEGRQSTGNAHRAGFQSPPQIMATNLYAIPGDRPRERMIQDLSQGILVLSLMGMHTANPISGDFSVGAEGLWVEKGRLKHPFRGVMIAGNIRNWLQSLAEVGSDLRFFGRHGSASLRVNGLQLVGV